MTIRLLSVSLLFGFIAAPAFADVKLEYKYKENSSYESETAVNMEQTLSIAGMDNKSTVEAKTRTRHEIGERDFAGKLKVKDKIQSLQTTINAAGSDYFFDSANPDNAGTSMLEFMRGIHKDLLHNSTTFTYDKDGSVSKIEFEKDPVSNLPQEVAALVKSQFDPEHLKKTANEQLQKIPANAIKPGDSWERTEASNVGAGQVLTFQTRYTYDGTVEKDGKSLDKISSKVVSVKFELQNDSPLPFKLKNSDLKPMEAEGVILFDREGGYTVEDTSSVRVVGEMTFVFNDNELPAKLDLKMRSSTTRK